MRNSVVHSVRTAMTCIPEVSGYLDRMTDAHGGLLRLQVAPSSGSEVNVMAQNDGFGMLLRVILE